MYTIAICSNSEDVCYEFKKTINFEDLNAAVNWIIAFLKKDSKEYKQYCFEIDEKKQHWFDGLDEDCYEEFYLTLTLVDESGYAGGYMSENAIIQAQLNYAENCLGEINFYDSWSVFSCNYKGEEDKNKVYSMLQNGDISASFFDE